MGIEALLTSQVIGLDAALNGKLSLTGGTLTGALSGTSATFSNDIIYKTATNNLVRLTSANGEGVLVFGNNTNATTANISTTSASANVRFSVGGNNRLDISGTQVAVNNANLSISGAILDGTTNILEQRNSTNAQTYRLYNTYTSSTSYENLQTSWVSNEARIGTSVGSAGGTQRDLVLGSWDSAVTWTRRFRVEASTGNVWVGSGVAGNGILRFGVNTTGDLTVSCAATQQLSINQRGTFGVSTTDAVWQLAGWSIARPTLRLGGSTSSFPAIKAVSASVAFRLADDSADCAITAGAATFSGNVTVSAVNIITDTTTGTKIGTATTQKIGFYDKTPVVQPTAVADATDAASVITQLNALLSRMRDLGLIAT